MLLSFELLLLFMETLEVATAVLDMEVVVVVSMEFVALEFGREEGVVGVAPIAPVCVCVAEPKTTDDTCCCPRSTALLPSHVSIIILLSLPFSVALGDAL